MIERHSHSGLNGDAEKIKARNIQGLLSFVTSNAGGNFKVGKSDRDSSDGIGTQSITGVGFQPSAIIIKAALVNNADGASSLGFSTGSSSNYCMFRWKLSGGYRESINPNNILIVGGADLTNETDAEIQSFDSDGFTINWTRMDTDCDFIWFAIA